MNNNLKIFSDFLGLGNPNSKFWFVGLEEGGVPVDESNFNEMLKSCLQFPHYFKIDYNNKISDVWNYISKILVLYNSGKIDGWEEFRYDMFCKDNPKLFLTELFPLPKNSYDSWPEFYKRTFGYSQNQIDEYKSEMINYRFPKIRSLWQKANPIFTICFGKSAWKYFEILFQLKVQQYKMVNSFKVFPEKRIILTPFLGRGHFSDRKVEEIVKVIKDVV